MAHKNIPIFIPHLGCPNACVFCNQRSISGKNKFVPESVALELERAVATLNDGDYAEIAFFGGSFTGIDRDSMIYLLELARKYIDDGRVKALRCSTRPDYIHEVILGILKKYKMNTIERGLQSMNDRVLSACRRGHTADDAERACRMIVEHGFELVGQMMIGLPDADEESELYTAKSICELGALGARIYPTVVFYETELCRMAESGEYTPVSLDDAIRRSKNVLRIFEDNNVKCIRVGLCPSENLASDEAVYTGPNHAALGELVMGELFYDRIRSIMLHDGVNCPDGEVVVNIGHGEMSKAVGQHRRNAKRLCEEFGIKKLKFKECDTDTLSVTYIQKQTYTE